MTAIFDLTLLPFYRTKGQEWPQLPGLRATPPPRRVARGREEDRLIVFLTLSGNTTFSTAEYHQLLSNLVERFYQCPGALTSALRAGADSVNQALVERNLRTTGRGQFALGRMILAVQRGSQIFLAQCGPTHAFRLGEGGSQHFYEEQNTRTGLGASQVTPIHFAQADIHAGDVVALCAALPPGWEETLTADRGSYEVLRRKLLSITRDDLNAVLVQVLTGKGTLTILHGASSAGTVHPAKPASAPSPGKPDQSSPTPAEPQPATIPSPPISKVASQQPASRFTRLISGQEGGDKLQPEGMSQVPQGGAQAQESTSDSPAGIIPQGRVPARPGRFVSLRRAGSEIPEISRPASPKRQQVFRGLAKWLRGVRVFSHDVSEKIKAFIPNLLPNLRDEEPRVTGASMVFIAIVIPLLVVMAAMTFYNKYGKSASYQENYDQALAASGWAAAQTDPAEIRVGWERTLYYLNIADDFQDTEELRELRQRAQLALDNLDGILRLDFSPAIIGGLGQAVESSRLAATSTDLYLLDAARGSVMRFYIGATGYQEDSQFNCGPGTYDDGNNGTQPVGELVDIIAAPKVNPYKATLIATDAAGNLLFCSPSPSIPIAVPLATPEMAWGPVSGITMDISSNFLYVLVSEAGTIWVYPPDEQGYYTTVPTMFFGAQVPANMSAVIDLATNGSDLYLLFNDGHVSACTLFVYENVPDQCADPVEYIDGRPERTEGQQIADASFSQLTFTEAPDQAVYLFDPLAQAVYRFSPRSDALILQGQFRASEEDRTSMLETTATAMAIGPNRYLFISVNGQVYYAADIP